MEESTFTSVPWKTIKISHICLIFDAFLCQKLYQYVKDRVTVTFRGDSPIFIGIIFCEYLVLLIQISQTFLQVVLIGMTAFCHTNTLLQSVSQETKILLIADNDNVCCIC